jgi:choline dehydrogenase-like flavoprotein
MKTYGLDETVDVVVIGTGAGGAPVLAKLAEAGLSVVALEAGRWWNPAKDYAADEVAMGELYWLGERLSAGETPTAFGGNNSGTGVGGSMLHWGAFVPRADPRDLKMRSDTGAGVDWPLTYGDLLPYYEEVERFIGVSGPADYPWDAASACAPRRRRLRRCRVRLRSRSMASGHRAWAADSAIRAACMGRRQASM